MTKYMWRYEGVEEPWVQRCPMGHSSVEYRVTLGKTHCRICGRHYDGLPFDAREVDEFPIKERR